MPNPATAKATTPTGILRHLFEDYSLEMTARDAEKLREARHSIPPATRINITFLGNEDLELRLNAARVVRELGFIPVPHVSARRMDSAAALDDFLTGLQSAEAAENIFVVAGDPPAPEGPFEDSLQLLTEGGLDAYGVRSVSISGYPEGHPDIGAAALWSALEGKAAELVQREMPGSIVTQFGFDARPVLEWIEAVREKGIDLPIRIGVAGPTSVRRILLYAARFGVKSSAGIARKYGFSLTNLLGTAGPEKFLNTLAGGYDETRHGELRLHFYTFGGLKATSEWATEFLKKIPN